MDVYEKLEELQEKALHDETMKQALLATRTEKEPIIAFCARQRSSIRTPNPDTR